MASHPTPGPAPYERADGGRQPGNPAPRQLAPRTARQSRTRRTGRSVSGPAPGRGRTIEQACATRQLAPRTARQWRTRHTSRSVSGHTPGRGRTIERACATMQLAPRTARPWRTRRTGRSVSGRPPAPPPGAGAGAGAGEPSSRRAPPGNSPHEPHASREHGTPAARSPATPPDACEQSSGRAPLCNSPRGPHASGEHGARAARSPATPRTRANNRAALRHQATRPEKGEMWPIPWGARGRRPRWRRGGRWV